MSYVSRPSGKSLAGPLLLPGKRDPRQAWLAWTGLNLLSSSPKATKRTRIAFTVGLLPLSDTFFLLPRHQPTQPLTPLQIRRHFLCQTHSNNKKPSTTEQTQPRIVGQDVDYQLVYVLPMPSPRGSWLT